MSAKNIRAPDARFSCQSCGRCCTMWSITVDEQTVERLRKHDWSHIGPGDPFLRNRGPGDAFRTRMVAGRCFFLAADKRCRIHSELGYEAKPAGCKAFPLHYTEVGGTSYARLSFYCPTVSENRGKKLVDQMRWLRAVRKHAGDVTRTAPLRLSGKVELSQRELDSIETQMRRWIEPEEQPMHTRLAACAGLLRLICGRVDDQGKSGIKGALQQASARGVEAMATLGREGGSASHAGPVLSLFLGSDCRPTKWARVQHFFGVRLFNLGLMKLRSQILGARASRAQIRGVAFDPPAVNNALLTRYFLHKLDGKRHVAGELDLISGFNLLVVAYGVINLLARLRAADTGRDTVDEGDVTAAVQAADLLVMEHTTINQKPTFALLVESILAQQTLCASLLARLS